MGLLRALRKLLAGREELCPKAWLTRGTAELDGGRESRVSKILAYLVALGRLDGWQGEHKSRTSGLPEGSEEVYGGRQGNFGFPGDTKKISWLAGKA